MMNAEPLVKQFLADDELSAVALAIATAYKSCTDFMRLNVVTSTFPIGMEQRPHILRAFVDHALMQMANYLPGFHHEMKWNEAHNCQHVRVWKGKHVITAHFMGRKDFRGSVRHAENRAILSTRNHDLFEDQVTDEEIFKDMGYVQILHGGYNSPEFLTIAIPNKNQLGIGASMELAVPAPDVVAAEQIKEEMAMKLKVGGGEKTNGTEATG